MKLGPIFCGQADVSGGRRWGHCWRVGTIIQISETFGPAHLKGRRGEASKKIISNFLRYPWGYDHHFCPGGVGRPYPQNDFT